MSKNLSTRIFLIGEGRDNRSGLLAVMKTTEPYKRFNEPKYLM